MDFNKAGVLLHILDKGRNWPNFKHISRAASDELTRMQDEYLKQEGERKNRPQPPVGSQPALTGKASDEPRQPAREPSEAVKDPSDRGNTTERLNPPAHDPVFRPNTPEPVRPIEPVERKV